MTHEQHLADELIPGSLKPAKSYHADDGAMIYGDIKRLAQAKPVDKKARQMKKLIEQAERLLAKV